MDRFICLLLIALSLGSSQALAASPAKPCNNTRLKGAYAMLLNGNTETGMYCSSTGMIRFDGEGHLNGRTIINCGDGAIEITNTGTYAVAADCSGTVTMSPTDPQHDIVGDVLSGSTDYAISIGDAGKSVFFVITTPGATTTGSAIRQ